MAKYSRSYAKEDIIKSLQCSGIESGDTVFFTTSLGMLGVLEGVESSEDLNQIYYDCILEVLGLEGTAIVPTYSYTFGKSTASNPAIYDPQETPAEIGSFPNYFRRQSGVSRTLDPMISVAGIGPQTSSLFSSLPHTSYGNDSIFARLVNANAKCCSIGLGPNWMPFIHYADWICKVPFRYDKLFHGLRKTNQGLEPTTWLYTVPILHPVSRSTAHEVGKKAVDAGIWNYAPLGRARVYTASYKDYFDFTLKQIRKDSWITATGPKVNPITLEEERVVEYSSLLPEITDSTTEGILLSCSQFSRPDVSDGANQTIKALARKHKLKVSEFQTGGNYYDCVIPGKWSVRSASINKMDGNSILPESELLDRVFDYSLNVKGEFSKDELFQHLRFNDGKSFGRHSVMLNRDWGFSFILNEKNLFKDAKYRVKIDSSISMGKMLIAENNKLNTNEKILLIVGYVNGPRFSKELLSAYAAIRLFEIMHTQSVIKIKPKLLLISGTAGFAAWLSRYKNTRQISVVIEMGIIDSEKLNIHFDKKFSNCELFQNWTSNMSSKVHLREQKNAYCLKSGLNPIALSGIPSDHFPIITLGSQFAMGTNGCKNQTALNKDDFYLIDVTVRQLFGLMKSE